MSLSHWYTESGKMSQSIFSADGEIRGRVKKNENRRVLPFLMEGYKSQYLVLGIKNEEVDL